jgi:1-phosphofructokinase
VIVTLTANPSVDRTLEVPALERGEVIRGLAARVHPGGKGVNVARALAANGVPVRAVLPSGGHEGRLLLGLLEGLPVELVPVPIEEPIRENMTVVEPNGTVTKLNAPGPTLSPAETSALVEATVRAAEGASWVALCGALPPGPDEALYADLVDTLRPAAARVAVDASGPALLRAVEAGPDLIKPNAEELAEAVGRPVLTISEVVEACRELIERGVGRVLASLGKDGAVFVEGGPAFRAWTAPVVPRSTVGAGDATLAGFLAAGGEGPEALRAAVAWGAASVRLPGTEMPGPGDIEPDEVTVEELRPGRAPEEGKVIG